MLCRLPRLPENGFIESSGRSAACLGAPVKSQAREDLRILSRMDCAKKFSSGKGGAVLEDVPHLTDWLDNLPVSILGCRIGRYTTGLDIERHDVFYHCVVSFYNTRAFLFFW